MQVEKKIHVQPLTLLTVISSTVIIIIKAIINLNDTQIVPGQVCQDIFQKLAPPPPNEELNDPLKCLK